MSKVYFISLQQIKDNTLLDTNISDKTLTVMLRTAQDIWLQELLGTSLFNLLKTNILANTITTKQRILIESYILNYLYALIEMLSVDDLLLKYSESGINSNNPQNTVQKSKDELSAIKVHKVKSVNFYAGLIKTYIENNISDFAEYEYTDEGVQAKKYNTYGFFLDDDDFEKDNEYWSREATNGKEESI